MARGITACKHHSPAPAHAGQHRATIACTQTVVCNPNRQHDRHKTDSKINRQANASAKSKELQPNTQSQNFAPHLLLPQPHNDDF